LPFLGNLLPDSFWTDSDWFEGHSEKLRGTSTLYKVTTKMSHGKSKEIVLKWNRMGQDIPGSFDVNELNVEFNSPFEEFALLEELRKAQSESEGYVLTHKPLAIYVPHRHVDLDRLGRKAYKMQDILSRHNEIQLNMHRNYAVIYEWIKGVDAVQALERGALGEQEMVQLTARYDRDIRKNGFVIADPKPHHVIVRPGRTGGLVRDRGGQILYAAVDFELLGRSPQREKLMRASKRKLYLKKQMHRFEDRDPACMPSSLKLVQIMGVDYIYGPVEGTGGALWVVGKDPTLFDYFLPEKWRDTPRIRLSVFDQVYRTTTKDDIHLVWKVSRVGELPDLDPFTAAENKMIKHGYNSPFEEVALSLELKNKGIPTTYPRAIYMAASKSDMDESLCDDSRYDSHKSLLTPESKPILRRQHDYIIFWGYWNGPDELLATVDESPYQGVDALLCHRKGLLAKNTYLRLMKIAKRKLASLGIEDLNLKGNHILLSVDNAGHLVKDPKGLPEMRISNFELLRRAQL
ncbi:MAG: hypothetical protein JSW59_04420, partial [Phycisphaerales bacterium]